MPPLWTSDVSKLPNDARPMRLEQLRQQLLGHLVVVTMVVVIMVVVDVAEVVAEMVVVVEMAVVVVGVMAEAVGV